MEPQSDQESAGNSARQAPAGLESREDALRRMLEARREAVVRRIREGLQPSQAPRGRTATHHPGRDALRQLADEVERELVKLAATTVRRLDAALDRLAEGRYGDCCECQRPIATRRLTVLPFAIRCVDCETTRDHGLARSGR